MEKSNSLKWLYKVPGRKKGYIVLLTVLQAVSGGSGVLYALLLRNLVDAAVKHDSTDFWTNVALTVLLVIGQILLRAVIRWQSELAKSTLENIFKERLLHNILVKDYASVSAVHSGEWLNRLTSDTVVVTNGYVDILPGLVGTVVKLISAIVMMIVLEWRFAVLMVPCGMLLILFTYAFRKTLKRLHKDIQQKDGKLRIFMQERIGSLMMIRSFAAGSASEQEAVGLMSEHKAARMRRNRFSNFCNMGFGFALNGMYLFGAIYCGYGILNDVITYGTMTAVTQLISQIQSPFANISGYLPRFYAMSASAERLMEIEQFEDDSIEPLTAAEVSGYYKTSLKAFGLRKAHFTYYPNVENVDALSKDNQPTVLDDISIEIRRGEYVAFTGHSGCGKSTVLKLLMSIYRLDSGERYLSDSDGERPLTTEWHRLFAYVPQGNQLMSGTVRDVISFADRSARDDDERINKALRIACADEFISTLENGTDTLLGERGTGLSEGQMQRIAIARALFADCPVLLLDEATSALDEQTERRLLSNLRSMTDKTVVIVTHRPAALEICDRVIDFSQELRQHRTTTG